MDRAEIRRLRYRRQYIISPESLDCPFEYQKLELNESFHLYAHVDLLVSVAEQGDLKVILLGDLFDHTDPRKSNQDIVQDLLIQDLDPFLEKIGNYSGKHVLIYVKGESFHVLTDPIAAKKVYYSNWKGQLWMASQPHLLAKLLGLKKTTDKSKIKYYQSNDYERLDRASIGNTTYYDEIFQLIPNHYLDASQFRAIRFWPREKIEIRAFEEVATESAEVIQGYMEAIAYRYKVMLPVTAGFDSRLLMAATRGIKEKVYYYINRNENLSVDHPDIKVPKKLLKKLQLDFHILELDTEIDEEFRTVYFENNPLATEKYLPHIYNYYMNYSGLVNLPGNLPASAIGVHELSEKNINPNTLAKVFRLIDYDHAKKYFKEWLEENQQLCEENDFSILRMLYQEERGANWMTQIQLDKEIAQEDINPCNSRKLVSLFLSVEAKYRIPPEKRLNKRIIEVLWPEILSVPACQGFQKRMMKLLASVNLLKYIYRIKYKTAR